VDFQARAKSERSGIPPELGDEADGDSVISVPAAAGRRAVAAGLLDEPDDGGMTVRDVFYSFIAGDEMRIRLQ
jgi:hypothetical protein